MGRLRNVETRVFRTVRRDPPQGKVHRIAFWFFASYLVFLLGELLPGVWGQFSEVFAILALLVLLPLCTILLYRWIFNRLLWRVRNRLVVTYLLMGLAPVTLFVTLALILGWVFSGQFATFAATSEINSQLENLGAQNRGFLTHIAHFVQDHPSARTVDLPEIEEASADREHAGLEIAAFEDDKPLALTPQRSVSPELQKIPEWAKGGYHGLIYEKGKLFLRAVDTQTAGTHKVTLVTSLPLHHENIDRLARGLGQVIVIPSFGLNEHEDEKKAAPVEISDDRLPVGAAPQQHSHVNFNVRSPRQDEFKGSSISGGELPPKEHFYDVTVSFGAPVSARIWENGETHEAFVHVYSRPSLLYQRLFITSIEIGLYIRYALIGIAIFFGVIELIAFVMAVRLNRTITRSVSDLYKATTEIDRGNLAHRITVTRNDQLAALSKSFNRMSSSLEKLLEEQREKQRLQNELAIAQEVQANLFPHENVALPTLELHGVCHPARTVSGDYYDFLLLGETGLGLALGDISGKGISAALLMATLHSAVRAYRFAGEELMTVGATALVSTSRDQRRVGLQEMECGELFEEPAKVLALLNRHLYRSTQPEKYATLFLAHYESRGARLTYSNGGQLPPLLLRHDDAVTRLDCGGTVVGLLDGMSYEQGTVLLHPGDILVAYSDGVTEPENEFGEFGEDRLVEIVRRHRHLPLANISEQVMQALRNWIGGREQPDDITLVLARQL
jgi:sigma-B regulation protein RsbU (phosphoserine phosphatase)